jgi:hypothetical protein
VKVSRKPARDPLNDVLRHNVPDWLTRLVRTLGAAIKLV